MQLYTNRQSLEYLISLIERQIELDYTNDSVQRGPIQTAINALREKDKAQRIARAEKARRVRPRYAPLHFSIPTPFGTPINGLEALTPREDYPWIIFGANHNLRPANNVNVAQDVIIRLGEDGRPMYSAPPDSSRQRAVTANYAQYDGLPFVWPGGEYVPRREQLHVTVIHFSEINPPAVQRQEADFVFHGLRVLSRSNVEGQLSREDRAQIEKAVNQRDAPEMRVLSMDLPFTAAGAAQTLRDVATREQLDEPLLVFAMQVDYGAGAGVALNNIAITRIGIEGEEEWFKSSDYAKQIPLRLMASAPRETEPALDSWQFFARPFYLPAGKRIIGDFNNYLTLDAGAVQGTLINGKAVIYLLTMPV